MGPRACARGPLPLTRDFAGGGATRYSAPMIRSKLGDAHVLVLLATFAVSLGCTERERSTETNNVTPPAQTQDRPAPPRAQINAMPRRPGVGTIDGLDDPSEPTAVAGPTASASAPAPSASPSSSSPSSASSTSATKAKK